MKTFAEAAWKREIPCPCLQGSRSPLFPIEGAAVSGFLLKVKSFIFSCMSLLSRDIRDHPRLIRSGVPQKTKFEAKLAASALPGGRGWVGTGAVSGRGECGERGRETGKEEKQMSASYSSVRKESWLLGQEGCVWSPSGATVTQESLRVGRRVYLPASWFSLQGLNLLALLGRPLRVATGEASPMPCGMTLG